MQHCILVKWTPDAGDRDALAKEAEAIFAQAVADGVATALTIRRNVINRPNRYDLLIELTMTPDMLPAYDASEPHHRWTRRVTGHAIPVTEDVRRSGDPARLVASSEKAQRVLGWTPRYSALSTILQTAWNWHSSHPDGF